MTLYSTEILRLAKTQFPKAPSFTETHSCRVHNPICGDRVEWKIHIEQGRVVSVWGIAKGCALCKASTALLLDGLQNQSVVAVESRLQKFIDDIHSILEGQFLSGDATLFVGVVSAPARKECVLLPWTAVQKMLHPSDG